jgi:hypothetical protein
MQKYHAVFLVNIDIVLGYPWLLENDFNINWFTGQWIYRQSSNNKEVFNFLREIEKENNSFLLISSDIGDDFAEPEYLFRNIKVIAELSL